MLKIRAKFDSRKVISSFPENWYIEKAKEENGILSDISNWKMSISPKIEDDNRNF